MINYMDICPGMEEYGFVELHAFFSEEDINEISHQLEVHQALTYDAPVTVSYNLLRSVPFVNQLAHSSLLISLVEPVLGKQSRPVNALVIDKSLDSNWTLDWHQDLKIAVKARIETTGFSSWTMESGIQQVVPPAKVLHKRLSVRIHLDDCMAANGAMQVIPGSHKKGIVESREEIRQMAAAAQYCELKSGGVMIFSPLLLHQSPYSQGAGSRRVLQIEYVGTPLENGLEWYDA